MEVSIVKRKIACYKGHDLTTASAIFLLEFGTVLIVWYFHPSYCEDEHN